jgi:hypothetical protein
MNAPEILHIVNSEDGLEVIVTELSEGTNRYRVKFRDTDADETVGILIFPDKELAEHYARSIIKGTKP